MNGNDKVSMAKNTSQSIEGGANGDLSSHSPLSTDAVGNVMNECSNSDIPREVGFFLPEDDDNNDDDDMTTRTATTGGDAFMSLSSPTNRESDPNPILSNITTSHGNLHPATTLMMKRVSSCYFSIGSSEGEDDDLEGVHIEESLAANSKTKMDTATQQQEEEGLTDVALVDVLYHDIMMHIFSYLDFNSLRYFSETALRPNFECFYFLQLQLQQCTIHVKKEGGGRKEQQQNENQHPLSRLPPAMAQSIIQTYLDSNSTLGKHNHMPLSHSLQYAARWLSQHHHLHELEGVGTAAFVMMIGAAAAAATYHVSPETAAVAASTTTGAAKFGLAAAGCSAVKAVVNHNHHHHHETDTSTQPYNQNNHNDGRDGGGITARLYNAFSSVYDASSKDAQQKQPHQYTQRHEQRSNSDDTIKEEKKDNEFLTDDDNFVNYAMNHPVTPNPYDHPEPSLILPQTHSQQSKGITNKSPMPQDQPKTHNIRKKPSGCVGAYLRATQTATKQLIQTIKAQRIARFRLLSPVEQTQLSTTFLDACTSDDSLSIVKELVQKIDADSFYIGSDGTVTCALHSAAFNGATKVVEYLCAGISGHDSNEDGGLCNVNIRDDNGWTAMHFAAGAGAVEIVQVLAQHGAKLSIEADNGYTPYHWAQRLGNQDVVVALENLGAGNRFIMVNNTNNNTNDLSFGSFVATRILSFLSERRTATTATATETNTNNALQQEQEI